LRGTAALARPRARRRQYEVPRVRGLDRRPCACLAGEWLWRDGDGSRAGAADNQRRRANAGPVVGSADARHAKLGQAGLSLRQLDSGGQHHERGAWCAARRRTAARASSEARASAPPPDRSRGRASPGTTFGATANIAATAAAAAAGIATAAAGARTSGAGSRGAARVAWVRPARHPLNSVRIGPFARTTGPRRC
jgi:hypothetical protein